MSFTDKDREKLIQVHTDVQWIKEEHGRRLNELEDEDGTLHHKINKVRNLYIGITAALSGLSAAGGALLAYLKTKGGQ